MHADVFCKVCGKAVMIPGANASLCTGLEYSTSDALENFRTPIRVLEQWMGGEEDDTYNQTFALCSSETTAKNVILYVLNYTRDHFGDDVDYLAIPRMPDSGYEKLIWQRDASEIKDAGDGYELIASLTITKKQTNWESENTPSIRYLLYKNEVAGQEIEYGMFIIPDL